MITRGQALFMLLLLALVVIAFITIEQPFNRAEDKEITPGEPSGFPEDTVDFSKLHVAIVKQMIPPYSNPAALAVSHPYDEIDTLPAPIRGYDYFEEVMVKELMKHDVFTFYDLKGKVTIEFTVGKPPSPNIVEGFSTREDTYEAYKVDGAFIKALNSLKVRWRSGKQGNSPVAVRMPLTFYVDGQSIRLEKTPSTTNAIADL